MTVNIASLDPEAALQQLFDEAVEAASSKKLWLLICRKNQALEPLWSAAVSMAHELEKHWQGQLKGLVMTRNQHGLACKNIEVIEASHPLPDGAGQNSYCFFEAVNDLIKTGPMRTNPNDFRAILVL